MPTGNTRAALRRMPLLWHLFPTYLLVVLIAFLGVLFYTSHALQDFYKARIAADLRVRAQLAGGSVLELLEPGRQGELNARVRELAVEIARADPGAGLPGAEAGGASPTVFPTRITVVLPDGTVAADSEEDPAAMDNHAGRPEIRAALAAGAGAAERHSGTLNQPMMYQAVVLRADGETRAVVRAAVPVGRVHRALWAVNRRILYGGLVAVVFAACVSLWVAQRISRPLAQMRRDAERFARGDFSRRLAAPDSREMASLAEALNQMARQLHERISTVISERNQQEAVLSSMVEGVVAVDTRGRIISFNAAAARMAGLDSDGAQGRPLDEAVPDAFLRDFVRRVLQRSEPLESEFAGREQDARILQAHGAVLRDAAGANIGAVVVLNDVTRLRRLEQVRRDFVANVSHELRTPITSIKGFVETLLDGACDNPEEARRFLAIAGRQADRLNAILSDLLVLSRVEEGETRAAIEFEVCPLAPTLDAAVQLCENRARQKRVRVDVSCPDGLRARLNPPLFEQAVVNLVDNAVKYSEEGGAVAVTASGESGAVLVRVTDHGCGIPAEHLPRLFERFYRVDKARSRSLGGTGLGLAIVKHIARAHGGRVSAESTAGRGSTFTIWLPAP